MKIRHVAALALVVLFGACTTGERISSVHEGMTRSEVVAILGDPDGFQHAGDSEAIKYTNRLISGWAWDRTDYDVILVNGRVVASGNGEVRERGPNMLIIVPLK